MKDRSEAISTQQGVNECRAKLGYSYEYFVQRKGEIIITFNLFTQRKTEKSILLLNKQT